MPEHRWKLAYPLVAVAVTAIYLVAYLQAGAFPAASGLVGHGIGIVGSVLMLMTETLYSIRKRLADARWGNMAGWLGFHMFTGLLGPYMVLLHTTFRFRGLAGVALLLTVVVVLSGLVGRYVYTAMPRTLEGADDVVPGAVVRDGLSRKLASRRQALAMWYSFHVPLTWALFATALVHAAGGLFYATLQR